MNERIYRGYKVSKGKLSIRKQRYPYRPHDIVYIDGIKYHVVGVKNKGTQIALAERKSITIKRIQGVVHTGAWYKCN